METEVYPLEESVSRRAAELQSALAKLEKPMTKLAALFRKRLADDNGALDSDTRKRLDSVASSLERRAVMTLAAWGKMLGDVIEWAPASAGATKDSKDESFVDWLEIERIDGRAVDVGMYRHFVDPMQPFAKALKPHMQGMAVTSATLRDSALDEEESWQGVRERTGAATLTNQVYQSSFDSPFDYQAQTKVFIINDVRKDDLGQVSGAYRALFQAAGGGALGLFTAISRLRAVQDKIAAPLEDSGLHLYAQHVDEADAGTLVDMFREDTHACLLGTDAVRDGVDVPGDSLRLIVFDRVPWPRPNILHKARRQAFGKNRYDEMQTRLKIKQAFGRLIRRAGDKGVFVMLDPMFPSRLHTAFPPDVDIQKIGLADAAAQIEEFLELKH
jgi:ATP-dependent DNA helicase DinG